MRIALAKLLLKEPEVLLLDEPTNHLDIQSQRWLEQSLRTYRGAICIISHDVALLDSLVTRTIAFHHGRAEEYSGNFSFYLQESKARKEILLRQAKAQQKEIAKTQAFIDRFRAKATKASQAQSRIKQLEKIELIEVEDDDAVMSFHFPPPPPGGNTVVHLRKVGKAYGPITLLKDYDFTMEKGDRIAIVGVNGSGKSTFTRLISGTEAPDSGEFSFGHHTQVAFFSQTHADILDNEQTILECVEAAASRETRPLVRNILGCFLFRGDDVFKKIGVLSGGERSRVALVCMLLKPANFLIMDEPTNHLDFQSQDVLQQALAEYPGSYCIVSHNRRFLDPIVNKVLEFRPGLPPRLFYGNVSQYIESIEAEERRLKALAVECCLLVVQGRSRGAHCRLFGVELLDLDGTSLDEQRNRYVGTSGPRFAYDERCRCGQFELTRALYLERVVGDKHRVGFAVEVQVCVLAVFERFVGTLDGVLRAVRAAAQHGGRCDDCKNSFHFVMFYVLSVLSLSKIIPFSPISPALPRVLPTRADS